MIDVIEIKKEIKLNILSIFIKNGDIYIKDNQSGDTVKIGELNKANWVEIDDYPHIDWECSCCGKKIYGIDNPYKEFEYCLKCGSQMVGNTVDYISELEYLKIAVERHKEDFPSDIKTIKEMHDRINELEKIVNKKI